MNSLEFIKQQITTYEELYENYLENLDVVLGTKQEKQHRFTINFYKERVDLLKEIKEELEIMEFIKNGWSGMETTISGKQVMKFQNLKLDDWIELWNRLEEILLKKSLEVKDEKEN